MLVKMPRFIIINFNEIKNILEKIKKNTLENYKHVQLKQIHQVSLSYMTHHTPLKIQRIMDGQITSIQPLVGY